VFELFGITPRRCVVAPTVASHLPIFRDLARDREPALRLHRDLVVVGEGDHGGAVVRDEGEDRLQPFVLSRDGVHERLALVRGQAGLERLDDRRVDADREVGQLLHERDRLSHQLDLVRQRVADVHVQHVCAAGHLLGDVDLDLGEVAGLQLRLERLAPGRVDTLADDAERLPGADPRRDEPEEGDRQQAHHDQRPQPRIATLEPGFTFAVLSAAPSRSRGSGKRFTSPVAGSTRRMALSPESVLTRGYSITRDAATGVILRSAAQASVEQKVRIQLGSGTLAGRVEEVEA